MIRKVVSLKDFQPGTGDAVAQGMRRPSAADTDCGRTNLALAS
jgi:hypothetical protein